MRRRRISLLLLAAFPVLVALLAGCDPESLSEDEEKLVASLSLDALPPAPDASGNRYADDPAAAAFGATLFFDTGMSANGAVSCNTCHRIDNQFQDGLPRGKAIGTVDRRTMPLAGVAWNRWFFWDGRRDSLWAQAITPMEDAREHGGNRAAFAHEMADRYADRYARIFGALPDLSAVPDDASPLGDAAERDAWSSMSETDRDAVNRVLANIGKAIAAFERTIPPPGTRFDRFARAIAAGEPPRGEAAFSDLEIEGLKLFLGPANCVECHNGPRFTDDVFHNTGVPETPGVAGDRGRSAAVREVAEDPFNCLGRYSDAAPDDCRVLRFMRRDDPALVRAYKTPSLRGVAVRAPYMHAGQFASLEEVVDHYETAPAAPAGTSELRSITLTERGRKALIAFLKTLDPVEAD